jgi:hypothetical protein
MGFRWWFKPKAAHDLIDRAVLDSLREVADFTAARAVVHAPVDTGFLASHIRMEELAGGLGFRVVSSAFYSMFVHEGFVSRGGTFVAGRPFLTLAIADARAEWPSIAARVSTGGTHNPEGFLSTTFTT